MEKSLSTVHYTDAALVLPKKVASGVLVASIIRAIRTLMTEAARTSETLPYFY